MKHPRVLKFFTLCMLISITATGYSSTNCQSDDYGNVNCSNGSGWQSDGYGGYNGVGSNSGGGWQSDGYGGYNGVGKNQGKNCQSDGFSGVNCN